jgi:hypothetical protein
MEKASEAWALVRLEIETARVGEHNFALYSEQSGAVWSEGAGIWILGDGGYEIYEVYQGSVQRALREFDAIDEELANAILNQDIDQYFQFMEHFVYYRDHVDPLTIFDSEEHFQDVLTQLTDEYIRLLDDRLG